MTGDRRMVKSEYRPSRTAIAAAMLALVAGLASGCGDDEAIARALRNAEAKLSDASVGGGIPLPSDLRRQKLYQDVLTTIKAVEGTGSPSQAGAAGLMQARAHAGLAEIQATNAAVAEAKFLADVRTARAVLDQWLSQNTSAAALDTYDPAKDLAQLDTQIAAKGSEAEQLAQAKVQQESLVAGIRAQAASVQAQSKTLREQEAAIRARAQGMSAAQRLTVVEEAAAKRREADALEKQAGELAANAAKEAPRIVELASQADRLKTQQELFRQAKKDIQARADAGKQHAASARAEAAVAGKKTIDLVIALAAARESASQPSNEAMKGYEAAIRSAKAAGSALKDAKTSIALTTGAFQQSLGDAQATLARGLGAYSGILADAVNARPALPGGAALTEKRVATQNEYKAALDAAEATYKSAKASFESSGGGAEVKSRIEAVNVAMKRLLDEREKATLDSATVEQQVRASIAEMTSAAESDDAEALFKHLAFKDDATRASIEAIIPISQSIGTLNTAAKAKFGKSLKELIKSSQDPAVKNNPILGSLAGGGVGVQDIVGSVPNVTGDGSKVEYKDGKATLVPAGGGSPVQFVKAGGEWKRVVEIPAAGAAQIAQLSPMLAKLKEPVMKVTEAVNADTFKSADEMLVELGKSIMAAMMGGGAGGGEKPADPAAPGKTPPPGGG